MNSGYSRGPRLVSIDVSLLISTILLCIIGVMFIYSSSITATGDLRTNEYLRQIIWLIPGILIMIGVAFVDYKVYRDFVFYIFLSTILLLLLTLFFGQVVYGGRRWIGVGGLGFQSSEFAKLAYILFMAILIEKNRVRLNSPIFLTVLLLITALPMGLILMQPDLGTASVFIPIFLVMIFVAGANMWFIIFFTGTIVASIFFALLPAWMNYVVQNEVPVITVLQSTTYVAIIVSALYTIAAACAAGWFLLRKPIYIAGIFLGFVIGTGILGGLISTYILRDYQMMRLVVFMNPNIDPRGAGWNILQSLTAVGSGGLTGKGFLLGTHSHYQYIPQQTTDFIFSIIAEEWGFIGSILLFILFLIIVVRGMIICRLAKDGFGAYVSAGIVAMIFYHFTINIGMAIGLMPITGLPLFFVSYGGSSLWIGLISIGILQSVYRNRHSY